MLKLVGIPLVGLLATRKLSGALLVGLAANFLNQLDTRPGRALKAYLIGALVVRAPLGTAVLLLPYDLREQTMLGDSGSNALGAMLGLSSVSRLTGSGRWLAIGALAALTALGERRSLGELIERTPLLSDLDRLGRSHSEPDEIRVCDRRRRLVPQGHHAASLGRLLKARGLSVQVQKFDPYINVDPGTMSPFQHGEVFVTEDGAETDLDIGHYERFIDENLPQREPHVRLGLVLGAAQGAQRSTRVDRAGHPAHHERDQGADQAGCRAGAGRRRHQRDRRHRRRHRVAAVPRGDTPVSPRGGCRERALPPRHVRALRRLGRRAEDRRRHSVNELRRIGIHPDIVVCRTKDELAHDLRDKIALFADIEPGAVVVNRDVPDVYLVPEELQAEGLDELVVQKLGLPPGRAELGEWAELTDRIGRLEGEADRARREVREAPGRLPLGARGAQARGHPPRLGRACALGRRRRHVAR